MHWHGLIDHSNVPGRRFAEFAELCKEAETLGSLRGTEIRSDVAILFSTVSEAAFKLQPQTDGYSYMEQIKLLHHAFAQYGLNVDIIDEYADISQYKAVCAPELYITDKAVSDKLHDFTRNGGTVIMTVRSGVKDKHNNCIMEQLPTVYRELVGCHISEYDPIGWGTNSIRFTDGEIFGCKQWCDIIEPDTADVLARYECDFYKGSPAVTVNRYGKGSAYYIGTIGERRMYEKLAKHILDQTGIAYIPALPENVEITTRTGNGVTAKFIFNNSDEEKVFALDGEEICVAPFEMKIKIK